MSENDFTIELWLALRRIKKYTRGDTLTDEMIEEILLTERPGGFTKGFVYGERRYRAEQSRRIPLWGA